MVDCNAIGVGVEVRIGVDRVAIRSCVDVEVHRRRCVGVASTEVRRLVFDGAASTEYASTEVRRLSGLRRRCVGVTTEVRRVIGVDGGASIIGRRPRCVDYRRRRCVAY